MDKILDLAISYPDFQLNQIIDPEQIDLNNSQIVGKINAIIIAINAFTQGTTGAGNIGISTLPEFPSAKNVQTALQAIATYCKANNTSIADLYSKLGAIDTLNNTQNTRLTAVENKNATQDTRLTNIEAKDTTQDTRLTNVEGRVTTIEGQNLATRMNSVESKNTQQDTRITSLEVKDELDEAWVQGIDTRVSSNTENIVRLGDELDEIREVNANAELVDARTSGIYNETYPSLKARLDKNEIQVKTDIPTTKRTKLNFLVVDADVSETWSDSVKLGDISVHESNDNAHGLVDKMNNAIAYHELDGTSHSDIRSEVSKEIADRISADSNLQNKLSVLNSELIDASYTSTLKSLSDVDLNTFEKDGEYWVNGDTVANVPVGTFWGKFKNKVMDSSNIFQEYTHHFSEYGVWWRVKTNGVWSEWKEFELYYSKLPSSVTDLNTFFTFGKWTVEGNVQASTITNVPITGKSFSIENIPTVYDAGKLSSNYVLQRLTYYQDSQGTWERRYSNIGGWGEWKKLATNQKAIPSLLNGWLVDGNLSVTRTGNTVFINGGVRGGSLVVDQPIMNIPIGFRRGEQFCVICTAQSSHDDATNIQVQILPNGDVVSNSPLKYYVKFNTFFEV